MVFFSIRKLSQRDLEASAMPQNRAYECNHSASPCIIMPVLKQRRKWMTPSVVLLFWLIFSRSSELLNKDTVQ